MDSTLPPHFATTIPAAVSTILEANTSAEELWQYLRPGLKHNDHNILKSSMTEDCASKEGMHKTRENGLPTETLKNG